MLFDAKTPPRPKSRLLGKLLIEPIEDPPIEGGAVSHFAMATGAFPFGKSHQRIRAPQRLKECRGACRERVIISLRYQRGTLD